MKYVREILAALGAWLLRRFGLETKAQASVTVAAATKFINDVVSRKADLSKELGDGKTLADALAKHIPEAKQASDALSLARTLVRFSEAVKSPEGSEHAPFI